MFKMLLVVNDSCKFIVISKCNFFSFALFSVRLEDRVYSEINLYFCDNSTWIAKMFELIQMKQTQMNIIVNANTNDMNKSCYDFIQYFKIHWTISSNDAKIIFLFIQKAMQTEWKCYIGFADKVAKYFMNRKITVFIINRKSIQ